MTITQMRYYQTICECRSFTKAAKLLNVTQPAISAAVRELEQECGVTLFERGQNVLRITDEGHVLLDHITPILEHYDELVQVTSHLQLERKFVRVGFATLFANEAYSMILTRFRRSHPDIEVRGIERSNGQLMEMLDDNRLDLVLSSRRLASEEEERYGSLRVAGAKMCFCVNAEHPYASKSSVTWEEISAMPLVLLGDRFSVGRSTIQELERRGLPAHVIHMTDQAYTVERFIENNTAAGFLPHDVAARNRFIVGLDYGDTRPDVGVFLYWRKDRHQFFATKAFLQTARECFREVGM